MGSDVYIHSVGLTRATSRPDKGFHDLCLEVGQAVLANVSPLKVDSFYVASMDPSLFGVTGEVAASLAAELGMLPRETLGVRGTSSAGGIGLLPAYKDIASGLYDYSLLISCEQMNRVARDKEPSIFAKRKEREAVQNLLRGVIHPDERRYGLTMILIGDMLEKALLKYCGISKAEILEIIPQITMAMYRRAAVYPHAHFFQNTVTREDYEKSRWVSPHYRRDDVVPPSTAACAILLSSRPPQKPVNDRVVRLKGIGQGFVHPALTRRFGPITSSPSIRRAIYHLARGASLSLEALRDADVGFPHDAFPSISRMILKEIGLSHAESLEGLLSGRYNPCGGLVKCGHPVGCSGELQIIHAFQHLSHDEHAVPEAIRQRPADTAFTASVGAALTNIVATFLSAEDVREEKEREREHRGRGGFDEAAFDSYLSLGGLYDDFEHAVRAIPAGTGIVLTNTRSPRGWVNLVQERDRKAMAISDGELPIGARVILRQGRDGLNRVSRVLGLDAEEDLLVPFGIIPGSNPPKTSGPVLRAV